MVDLEWILAGSAAIGAGTFVVTRLLHRRRVCINILEECEYALADEIEKLEELDERIKPGDLTKYDRICDAHTELIATDYHRRFWPPAPREVLHIIQLCKAYGLFDKD